MGLILKKALRPKSGVEALLHMWKLPEHPEADNISGMLYSAFGIMSPAVRVAFRVAGLEEEGRVRKAVWARTQGVVEVMMAYRRLGQSLSPEAWVILDFGDFGWRKLSGIHPFQRPKDTDEVWDTDQDGLFYPKTPVNKAL